MKAVMRSSSVVEHPIESKRPRPVSLRLSGFATRLLKIHADRWKRRAQFYERHRDYFPRLASGRFVDRCRELEASYRGLAQVLFAMPPQIELVPVRVTVSRLSSRGAAGSPGSLFG